MQTPSLVTGPTLLSDDELTSAVGRLASSQREITVTLVAHLMEFEARRLYLPAGCTSMFVYCTTVLRLSEHEAYHRIEAARLVRRFPIVLDMLAEGTLTLTTARLLSQHLTTDNLTSLLAEAAGRSKREVQRILARAFPQPPVATSIRKVPVRPAPADQPPSGDEVTAVPPVALIVERPGGGTIDAEREDSPSGATEIRPLDFLIGEPQGEMALPAQPEDSGTVAAPESTPSTPSRPAVRNGTPADVKRSALVRPLSGDLYELRVTITADTREKLREATDLLRHAVPGGDAPEILDRALTALLSDLRRRKCASTRRPRSERETSGASGATAGAQGAGGVQTAEHNRHIPAQVKRAVWDRDQGQCVFVGAAGRRCGESGFVEFHHARPYAVGGRATVENIELRCRAHNGYEAEVFYGERWRPAADRPDLGPSTRSGPS